MRFAWQDGGVSDFNHSAEELARPEGGRFMASRTIIATGPREEKS